MAKRRMDGLTAGADTAAAAAGGAAEERPAALPALGAVLPALVLGTATFNTQYVSDPRRMPSAAIVARAVALGVRGFDTSPYYGPAEALLGAALAAVAPPLPRDDYFLITKAGRVGAAEFDYSAAAVRASVLRSLARLRTWRLDLVYVHDVEFAPADVVGAVRALRALRAEGVVRYVGISGFPLDVLCGLAERVLRDTGEPVDAVLSYGHCTVQNTALAGAAVLARLSAARVAVVLNASMLNMGLLTARGVDAGPQAAWHPAPPPLRRACARVADACRAAAEPLERLAIRYSLERWARAAPQAGLGVASPRPLLLPSVGASVIGVTSVRELEETVAEWECVLAGLAGGEAAGPHERRRQQVDALVHDRLWPLLGEWKDYSWPSPPEDRPADQAKM